MTCLLTLRLCVGVGAVLAQGLWVPPATPLHYVWVRRQRRELLLNACLLAHHPKFMTQGPSARAP